jgi:hypothetical protein
MARPTANTSTPAGTGGYILTKADEGQLAFSGLSPSPPELT